MKRTFQPNKRRKLKKHGFLSRSKKSSGKDIISRRREKGRHEITVSDR